jgi:hypothetical protein
VLDDEQHPTVGLTEHAHRAIAEHALTMRDFRHATTADGARKAGHLTGLSYLAGQKDQPTTSGYPSD